MEAFQGLSPQLQKALVAMKFEVPTPIQAQAIPLGLSGKDIIACAQTGTGKTVAFGVPIVTAMFAKKGPTALVLVPTRELADQVSVVFRKLTLHMPHVRTVQLIGGMSMQPQMRALFKGYRIVVATPGRLLDHLNRGSLSLKTLEILTLDEADRMLDMGFAPQLQEIFSFLPKKHQTLLFSATLPANIKELGKAILHDPVQISIGAISKPVEKIAQSTRAINGEAKNAALLEEINQRTGSILVFARTQKRTDRLTFFLESQHVQAERLHGGLSQNQRTRALQAFREGQSRILVATDVAARGIDIDHVEHVINFDLPQVAEDYIHRIGRTARAGRGGSAVSLISHEERPMWREIEKLLVQTRSKI